jgi:hypothetical protein
VLDRHDDAAARIERSRHAARDNPIAAAMVERAAAIAAGDRAALARLSVTFAQLGCPYQQSRTARLAEMPACSGPRVSVNLERSGGDPPHIEPDSVGFVTREVLW